VLFNVIAKIKIQINNTDRMLNIITSLLYAVA